MATEDLSREELFALVWEKPASEGAAELGFSDVALGKLCRRLQVPKPPRGYWAKVQAGQKPRRPPLTAFREELESKRKKQEYKRYVAHLSKLQIETKSYSTNTAPACSGSKPSGQIVSLV